MKKLFIIAAMLLSLFSYGQNKDWKHISKNDIAIYSLQTVAGFADGTNQAIIHHGLGAGHPFWDQTVSWKNKYRDFDAGDKRAAFPGSKTYLVAFTDGFHLTRFVDRSATLASVVISVSDLKQYPRKDRWKVLAKKAVLSAFFNRAGFYLSYNGIFKQ